MDVDQSAVWTAGVHSTALMRESQEPPGLFKLFHIFNLMWHRSPAISYTTAGSHITFLGLCFLTVKLGVRLDELGNSANID